MSEGDSRSCFIHFKEKSGELCKFTPRTIVRVKEYCAKWLELDGEPKEIALRIANVVQDWPDGPDHVLEILPAETVDLRYHKECYVRFCDKSKVTRVEKRMKNIPVSENPLVTLPHDEESAEVQSMRSSARIASMLEGGSSTKRRSIYVMPEQCIICKRKDAYIMDKVYL